MKWRQRHTSSSSSSSAFIVGKMYARSLPLACRFTFTSVTHIPSVRAASSLLSTYNHGRGSSPNTSRLTSAISEVNTERCVEKYMNRTAFGASFPCSLVPLFPCFIRRFLLHNSSRMALCLCTLLKLYTIAIQRSHKVAPEITHMGGERATRKSVPNALELALYAINICIFIVYNMYI